LLADFGPHEESIIKLNTINDRRIFGPFFMKGVYMRMNIIKQDFLDFYSIKLIKIDLDIYKSAEYSSIPNLGMFGPVNISACLSSIALTTARANSSTEAGFWPVISSRS